MDRAGGLEGSEGTERRHYAKCGRREVSREAFLRDLGISAEDVLSPDERLSSRQLAAAAAAAAEPAEPLLSAEELKERGNAAFQQGQYSEAIHWFTEALEGEPDSHMLHSNRSAAYLHCNKQGHGFLTMALYDADKCIGLRPQWFKGHGRRGDALMAMGQLNEAVNAYEHALSLCPGGANKPLQKALKHCVKLRAKNAEGKLGAATTGLGQQQQQGQQSMEHLIEDLKQGGSGYPSGRDYLTSGLREYQSEASAYSSVSTSAYNSLSTTLSDGARDADASAGLDAKYVPSDADISRPIRPY
eukprot:Rhum_TRINITY_DN23800_c0_g1::Rhum_TRINITY_DN23800_c0_g1_i1::g.178756::m.178756/K09553/STIP1; stress-induced-phosphoprotein 1